MSHLIGAKGVTMTGPTLVWVWWVLQLLSMYFKSVGASPRVFGQFSGIVGLSNGKIAELRER